ncbi:hypothetical protein BDK51DRAFT_51051, partial [Blyttiomyces helicus]
MPVTHYRIYRVAEALARLNCPQPPSGPAALDPNPPLQTVLRSTPSTSASSHLLLVGRLKSSPAPDSTQPVPGIIFEDRTGSVRCEFAEFDLVWLDRDVCLWAWTLAGAVLASCGTPVAPYLEVAAPPLRLRPGHFLLVSSEYHFTSDNLNVAGEMESGAAGWAGGRTREGLLGRYRPVSRWLMGCEGGGHDVDDAQFVEEAKARIADLDAARRVAIHGRIGARSTVCSAGRSTYFFAEIVCGDADAENADTDGNAVLTAFVLCAQDGPASLLPLFEAVRVGASYLFVDLRTAEVKVPVPGSNTPLRKKVLQFMPGQSKLFRLDTLPRGEPPSPPPSTSANELLSRSAKTVRPKNQWPPQPPDPTPPSPHNSDSRISRVISYTGRITALLDPAAAIYELDDAHHLYLAFHDLPSMGRGLRIGATLHLFNTHLVVIPAAGVPTPKGGAPTANKHKAKPLFVFVPCPCSSVTIAAFSPGAEACKLWTASGRRAALGRWARFNVPDIFAAWRIQMHMQRVLPRGGVAVPTASHFCATRGVGSPAPASGTVEWTIAGLLAAFGYVPYRHNREISLLDHARCTIAEWRYPRPEMVCIADVLGAEAAKAFVVAEMSEAPRHRILRLADMDFPPAAALVAMLCTDNAGAVRLVDATGGVRVVIVPGSRPLGLDDVDRVWVVRSFDVLVEVVGGRARTETGDAAKPLHRVTVRFSLADAVRADGASPPSSLVVPPDSKQFPSAPPPFLFRVDRIPLPGLKVAESGAPIMTAFVEGHTWALHSASTAPDSASVPTALAMSIWQGPDRAVGDFSGSAMTVVPTLHPGAYYLVSGTALYPERRPNDREHDIGAGSDVDFAFGERARMQRVIVESGGRPPLGILNGEESNASFPRLSLRGPRDFEPPPPPPPPHSVESIIAAGMADAESGRRPGSGNEPLFALRARLVALELRDGDLWPLPEPTTAGTLWVDRGVDCGRRDRSLFLRVADHAGSNLEDDPSPLGGGRGPSLDIYFDARQFVTPPGMVPGCILHMDNLRLRVSGRGSYYGTCTAATAIRLCAPITASEAAVRTEAAAPGVERTRRLVDLAPVAGSEDPPGHVRVRASVVRVLDAALWLACSGCGTHSDPAAGCPNGCTPSATSSPISSRLCARIS